MAWVNLPLIAALAAQSLRNITHFVPQGLSNPSWAFAFLGLVHRPLLDSISSSALPLIRLRDFLTPNIARPAWSVSVCICFDKPLMEALASKAIRRINECDAQNLTRTSWALAGLS